MFPTIKMKTQLINKSGPTVRETCDMLYDLHTARIERQVNAFNKVYRLEKDAERDDYYGEIMPKYNFKKLYF